ncbi:hypothetical protein CPB84DRAFT_1765887 [Gymnopilus junonius]|uniref:Uncharacterized protein n=1 Tax=Gymnopilus junonius TaxID=109634 RepID=A0A9P5TTC3_GYMJU|nr:hypothetical protein CPB84DRAFT_1765887 [Gymnopilus junonius]
MDISTTDINLSLEPHVALSLQRIFPLLPPHTARLLEQYITIPLPTLIPYNVLFSVSQWARSEGAQDPLKSNQLDPQNYSMVALLAGTTTSPERKFATYVPPKDPEEVEADRMRERRAITYLLNALLSIGGVGFAAWWAADKTGWSNEWRVLFALFAAIVVAVSEAGLYMIWQSRSSTSEPLRKKRLPALHKKVDPATETDTNSVDDTKPVTSASETGTLRQRR